jgi:hypothetical protein
MGMYVVGWDHFAKTVQIGTKFIFFLSARKNRKFVRTKSSLFDFFGQFWSGLDQA